MTRKTFDEFPRVSEDEKKNYDQMPKERCKNCFVDRNRVFETYFLRRTGKMRFYRLLSKFRVFKYESQMKQKTTKIIKIDYASGPVLNGVRKF